jgi:hypothetical protein
MPPWLGYDGCRGRGDLEYRVAGQTMVWVVNVATRAVLLGVVLVLVLASVL